MSEYKTREQKIRFYKSKEWKELRLKVLERDNYECRKCRELGYVTLENSDKHKSLDVDHIKEIYTNPELALDPSNLQTLCVKHHNLKHGRVFGRKPNKWEADERW
ncbi:HNH endonuclease [Priestia megaterium]|uniref:HNH endonuclease n=1 Tax=Priestia megaterium TaxID=1404 RepID=UPI001EDC4471|nr:HNH endonuclease signature motif containing protein [Priestia megaterium]UKJ82890.1 HNH endonuclease [Priestia megaterium]